MDPMLEDEAMILDPEYQSTLYLIEDGLREVGVIAAPTQDTLPAALRTQLADLIDSVAID
jgi:hypothetical protein